MKKTVFKLTLTLFAALMLTGCEKDEEDSIKIADSKKTLEMHAVVNNSLETTMQVKNSWTAKSDARWLNVSPAKGDAGENITLTLTTTQTNRTKATRTAKVTIQSGGETKTLTVKQRADYAIFDKDQYELTAAGGTLP